MVSRQTQMAGDYGICRKAFNKLLTKQHPKPVKGVIYLKEQLKIYFKFGIPRRLEGFPMFPKISQKFLLIPN
jgi:hypothetical protein